MNASDAELRLYQALGDRLNQVKIVSHRLSLPVNMKQWSEGLHPQALVLHCTINVLFTLFPLL